MTTIPIQLTNIYFDKEDWHKGRMSWEQALQYHKTRYENGYIHVYEENGEVLGYYERYIRNEICILYNIWIKEECRFGKVFKELYKHFFLTLPINVTEIIGERVKLGGAIQRRQITRKR